MKSEEMKLQRPFVNLGIATWELKLEMELQLELIWHAIFSSTIRSIDHKLSRVVTYDEWTLPTKSRDTSIKFSRDKSKLYYLQFHIMQNLRT